MDNFKTLVIIALLAILFSLGKALFHMNSNKSDSRQMARALTWRIGLSVALLLLMLFGAHEGWISPHGLGR